MTRLFRPLAAALVLAVAVPATALASTGANRGDGSAEHVRGGDHAKNFPMKAADFKAHAEKRIAKQKEKLEAILTKKNVPEAKRAQIRKDVEAGVATVRAAIDKAAADGTVTADEAKQVRAVSKDAKRKAMEKNGIEWKGKGGKGKRDGAAA
ncbi:MAG: hypothetical protein WKG00_17150 [Polyangiaceae bacterium]